MNIEITILYCIFNNSNFGESELEFSEFSEIFLTQEIKNYSDDLIGKLSFIKHMNNLELKGFVVSSSKHHLTTVNSWRLSLKAKRIFERISRKGSIDFSVFKDQIETNLR